MKKYKDIIAGSVLLVCSIAYFIMTLGIKKVAFIDPVTGSALFPRIVATILILCSVVIVGKGIISLKKEDKAPTKKSLMDVADEAENSSPDCDASETRKGSIKVVLVLLSFALFCFLMDKIGFAIASFLYLWSQMVLMAPEKQSYKKILFEGALSLILAIGIFAMFRYGFGLILPKARWF